MSMLLGHLLMFYKYGGKQLYYFTTNDQSGEIDVDKLNAANTSTLSEDDDSVCESCAI